MFPIELDFVVVVTGGRECTADHAYCIATANKVVFYSLWNLPSTLKSEFSFFLPHPAALKHQDLILTYSLQTFLHVWKQLGRKKWGKGWFVAVTEWGQLLIKWKENIFRRSLIQYDLIQDHILMNHIQWKSCHFYHTSMVPAESPRVCQNNASTFRHSSVASDLVISRDCVGLAKYLLKSSKPAHKCTVALLCVLRNYSRAQHWQSHPRRWILGECQNVTLWTFSHYPAWKPRALQPNRSWRNSSHNQWCNIWVCLKQKLIFVLCARAQLIRIELTGSKQKLKIAAPWLWPSFLKFFRCVCKNVSLLWGLSNCQVI